MSLTSVLITPCVAVHSCDTAGILGLRVGWGGGWSLNDYQVTPSSSPADLAFTRCMRGWGPTQNVAIASPTVEFLQIWWKKNGLKCSVRRY